MLRRHRTADTAPAAGDADEERQSFGRLSFLAGRRFAVLFAGSCAITAAASLLFGLLAGASLQRSLSVGFYLAGSFLLVGGFFVGNRGPLRLKNDDEGASFLPFWGSRVVRWADPHERNDAINTSAIYVVLGLALVLVGVIVDSRYELF